LCQKTEKFLQYFKNHNIVPRPDRAVHAHEDDAAIRGPAAVVELPDLRSLSGDDSINLQCLVTVQSISIFGDVSINLYFW
jgi:hypothetical protein